MELLAYLATTGGAVVSKDEIIDTVWEGRAIAEATLTRSIADLRRALGDDQRCPVYIETIAKRGYRLIATVSFEHLPEYAAASRRDDVVNNGRVADRLASARQRRFIGREPEVETFRAALRADEPPFVVWHINGPGGVGKTTLIQEFARVAEEAGRRAVIVDGRNIEPTATGFLAALSQSLGIYDVDLENAIARWPAGAVLFVDTYELLAPADDWLRRTLLPQLPARSLVVVAGRNEPVTTWRTDVEWAALTRVTPLSNLGPTESRTYL